MTNLNDSGSAGTTYSSKIGVGGHDSTFDQITSLSCAGLANDAQASCNAVVGLDANGDMKYQIWATGSNTLDTQAFMVLAVGLR